jgi:hypothetical protein
MPQGSGKPCALLALALLVALALCGCAGAERATSAGAQGGVIGDVAHLFKQEYDREELKELADNDLTAEERQEARADLEEQQGGQAQEGEGAQEAEGAQGTEGGQELAAEPAGEEEHEAQVPQGERETRES